MSLLERLLASLPAHKDYIIRKECQTLYICDRKPSGGGFATMECEADDVPSVVINNPHSTKVEFDPFQENALPISEGNYESQCECVLFPVDADIEEWVLFLETKYVKSLENAQNEKYGYPEKMVSQIKRTVDYFRKHSILDPDKKVYAIVSFPPLEDGYESWTFPIRYSDGSTESVEDLFAKYRIHIRATNSATIKSAKRIKLGLM